MIKWRNTPIDQLNDTETRQALAEMCSAYMQGNKLAAASPTMPVFYFGLASGVFASLLGILFAQIVFS